MRLPILTLTALAALAAPANAEVVFGNLGADGTGGRDDTNTDVTSTNFLAVGFNVGNSEFQYLQSISIWAFPATTGSYELSLYTGISAPNLGAGAFAVSDSLTLVSNVTGLYEFDFNGISLVPNATYWVVAPEDLSWYAPSNGLTASAQNASGYLFEGNIRSQDTGATWGNYFVPYSISIEATNAIPEPSTYGMILGGLALVGAAVRRRRKSA
jgi:hypothetical protein